MFALWWREHAGDGRGQVIDLAIYEPLFWLLGPQALVYEQLGIVQERTGNAAPFTAPRNAYRSKDGRWLGLSASAQSIAERVMKIVGREDLVEEPWFRDHAGRVEHADELDAIIQDWIGQHTTEEVLATFAEHEAAIAPVNSIADIFADPQFRARRTVTSVEDRRLGPVTMQNVIPTLSETPGRIDHTGPDLGEHNHEIYVGELGLSDEELAGLQQEGVI
jgi:formyl-CoA transferase